MTDRELLELAAKAAGVFEQGEWFDNWYVDENGVDKVSRQSFVVGNREWNPLTDDGDALRLAVKLKIHHRQYSNQVQIRGCWCRDGYIEASCKDIEEREPIGNDPYAATRRAIVRAAAEIGKAMK